MAIDPPEASKETASKSQSNRRLRPFIGGWSFVSVLWLFTDALEASELTPDAPPPDPRCPPVRWAAVLARWTRGCFGAGWSGSSVGIGSSVSDPAKARTVMRHHDGLGRCDRLILPGGWQPEMAWDCRGRKERASLALISSTGTELELWAASLADVGCPMRHPPTDARRRGSHCLSGCRPSTTSRRPPTPRRAASSRH
jgi:hypothetical protein